jgi:hypothetical protein
VNKTDTAHTLLGREQCDEDDFGLDVVHKCIFERKLI